MTIFITTKVVVLYIVYMTYIMNVHESKVVPLIFFIYIGASHWVCTAHIVPSKDIEVMDSIGANELTDTTLLQIATVYKTNTQLLRMKYSAAQLQKGAHDCGLFSIANAIEVCEGNDPAKQQYQQERMRKHLIDCFTKKHLLPFPKANKGTKPRPRPKAT